MEILKHIDQLKAELDALRPLDAEREARIMQKFRLDWNFHSNHLEGNSLSYGETKALILFGITAQGKPLKDHLEMTGHNEAIKWIEEVIKEERPLTENFIRQLHELLLKEPYQVDAVTPDGKPTKKWIQIGQYKSSPNNVVTVTGEIFYFATPEETPAMMTDLVDWYRTEKEKSELHPLQLAALFHYRFVRIHPFDDGNGRTARILMNFILMQHGLPPVIIKTEDKENYFAALRQADAGLLEPFIAYIGKNLERSLDLMVRGAKGESIDEPDDVDKEIALIQQKLKSINPEYDKFRSKESLEDLLNESLKRLILGFCEQSMKFKNLYESTKYSLVTRELTSMATNCSSLIVALTKKILKMTTPSYDLIDSNFKNYDPIFIQIKFEDFVGNKTQAFDYYSGLRLWFYKHEYKLETKEKEFTIEKLYYDNLTEEEIESLIRVETKRHTAFINQKIEEAQQKITPKE